MSKLVRIGIPLVLIFLAACSKEASKDVPTSSQGSPDEIFSDFVTQESDSGKTKWKLMAPKASKFRSKGLIVLEKPKVEFFDEKGEIETTLTADNGEYYQDSQNMLAYGNVVVVSKSGDVLETDSLFWDDAKGKIKSESFVKITRGKDVLTGIGLECDYNLSSIDIKKDVQATIIDQEGKSDE